MMERINEKAEPKNKRSVLTFLVFLVISTALWLLIKLSNDYSTQTTFSLQLEEVPADKWISSPELAVKMSLNTDGFHTLRCKMIREPKRVVTIPLNEVPYRQETGNTYSFSSQYVAERIADFLGIGQHLRDPHHRGSRRCPPLTPIHGLAAEVVCPPMWWGAPAPKLGVDSCPLPDPAVSDPAPPHHTRCPQTYPGFPIPTRRWVWRDLSQL